MEKSKLLMQTFDAQLTELTICPKCNNTVVSYKLKMYDETLRRYVTKTMLFEYVIAIEFHMNYFDAPVGAEVCGFYELLQRKQKEAIIERNFISRKNRFLFHGHYNYDPKEPNDLLNNREAIEHIFREIDDYHIWEQQTIGGTYLLLSKTCTVDTL